jgi:hypothetical protein
VAGSQDFGAAMKFKLEFYEDEHGDSPVLRWLREELTPTQRRASGCGKQLGDGLF